MSPTREELLAGVVKVNDERIDRKDPEVRDSGEVSGRDSSKETASTREPDRDARAASGVLQKSKESLQEFVIRRSTEVAGEMEEVEDAIARVEAELAGLREERGRLVAERKQLEKLSASSLRV